MKVVFVSSLPHSGSTLTDFILGAHPAVISFGEVEAAILKITKDLDDKDRVCSCGQKKKDCVVFNAFEKRVQEENITGYRDLYKAFLEVIAGLYGENIILVDSSKNIRNMITLREVLGEKLRVVFLIKDMRSYAISQLDRNKKIKEFNRRSFFLWNVFSWYRWNKKILNFLDENRFEYFKLGYEELAISYQKILPKICDYLDIEFTDKMYVPKNNTTSHITYGNAWIKFPEKLESINYDYRWFTRKEVLVNSLFLVPFFAFNTRHVYSNLELETVSFINKKIKK